VDRLLALPQGRALADQAGRTLAVEALRVALDETRGEVLSGRQLFAPAAEALVALAGQWLDDLLAPTLRPVINATGIIVHTNLGRAPLSQAARTAIEAVGRGYSTLEYDVEAGQRGSRTVHAEALLTRLTGAEAALAVNNNAAALLLMLTSLCAGKEVLISRGQLVEIGGGFRIPDVMTQSGAKLVEVGTTNRTHLRDYADAITENTAAILVAHYSNYKIIGFTSQPSLSDLAALARDRGVWLLYDQGSGALVDVSGYGLEPEPTVQEGLADGCDVVCFSGDKLLGGPQAGLLVGRAALVGRMKRHPLARAVRADKLCLAGLSATLLHYLDGSAEREVPVLWMIARPLAELADTAERWAASLRERNVNATVVAGESRVGGGSLPGTSLPTMLVAVSAPSRRPDELATALRARPLPVIGRVQNDRLLIDPRTVLPGQADELLAALAACCAS
jgi:L-seryl-tRNA(Ser) seleniumtransferase